MESCCALQRRQPVRAGAHQQTALEDHPNASKGAQQRQGKRSAPGAALAGALADEPRPHALIRSQQLIEQRIAVAAAAAAGTRLRLAQLLARVQLQHLLQQGHHACKGRVSVGGTNDQIEGASRKSSLQLLAAYYDLLASGLSSAVFHTAATYRPACLLSLAHSIDSIPHSEPASCTQHIRKSAATHRPACPRTPCAYLW